MQGMIIVSFLLFFKECGMNVHHKCENKVGNLCGVNQKLMAEALAMIESTQQVNRIVLIALCHSNSIFILICS